MIRLVLAMVFKCFFFFFEIDHFHRKEYLKVKGMSEIFLFRKNMRDVLFYAEDESTQ